MATKISRTFKTYKAIAETFDYETGKLVNHGEVVIFTTTPNDAQAREAFKTAGNPQKRGTHYRFELVEEVTYEMTVEDFLAHAMKVEK